MNINMGALFSTAMRPTSRMALHLESICEPPVIVPSQSTVIVTGQPPTTPLEDFKVFSTEHSWYKHIYVGQNDAFIVYRTPTGQWSAYHKDTIVRDWRTNGIPHNNSSASYMFPFNMSPFAYGKADGTETSLKLGGAPLLMHFTKMGYHEEVAYLKQFVTEAPPGEYHSQHRSRFDISLEDWDPVMLQLRQKEYDRVSREFCSVVAAIEAREALIASWRRC